MARAARISPNIADSLYDRMIERPEQGESSHGKVTAQRACCKELANHSVAKTKDVKLVFITRSY